MATLEGRGNEDGNPTYGEPLFPHGISPAPGESGSPESSPVVPWPAYGVTFGVCECGTAIAPLPVERGSMSDGEIYPERCLSCQPSYAHVDGCKCERCEEDRCSLLSEVLWDIVRTAPVVLLVPRFLIEVLK